jgi:hypothetical protein
MGRALILFTLPVLLGAGSKPAPAADKPADQRSDPVLVRTFPLEGVRGPADRTGIAGRIDHMRCDPLTSRLFIACVANGSLEVIDLDSGARAGTVAGLRGPQGVGVAGHFVYVSTLDSANNRLFVVARKPARLISLSARDGSVLGKAPCPPESDDLIFDPRSGLVAVIGGGSLPTASGLGGTGASLDVFVNDRSGQPSRWAAHPWRRTAEREHWSPIGERSMSPYRRHRTGQPRCENIASQNKHDRTDSCGDTPRRPSQACLPPGCPVSTTNDARVTIGAPGVVTFSTTW